MAGKFIVIEGMDGAGTTTQTQMLADYLAGLGYKVVKSNEPTSSPIGQEIRRLLKSAHEPSREILVSLALCFAADRMHHIHEHILPGLRDNDFVIVDRYLLSSLVYQGLHLPTSFIREINKFAVKPHLTVVLDLAVTKALLRIKNRSATRDFYETKVLLEKIRERYQRFALKEPDTVLIDADGSTDEVHSHVSQIIAQKFGL